MTSCKVTDTGAGVLKLEGEAPPTVVSESKNSKSKTLDSQFPKSVDTNLKSSQLSSLGSWFDDESNDDLVGIQKKTLKNNSTFSISRRVDEEDVKDANNLMNLLKLHAESNFPNWNFPDNKSNIIFL